MKLPSPRRTRCRRRWFFGLFGQWSTDTDSDASRLWLATGEIRRGNPEAAVPKEDVVPGFFSSSSLCIAHHKVRSPGFKHDWEWCTGSARYIDTERRGANGSHNRAATFGLKLFFNKGSGSPAGGRLFLWLLELAGWLTRGRRPPPPHRLPRFFFFVCVFFPLSCTNGSQRGLMIAVTSVRARHAKHNTRRFLNKN